MIKYYFYYHFLFTLSKLIEKKNNQTYIYIAFLIKSLKLVKKNYANFKKKNKQTLKFLSDVNLRNIDFFCFFDLLK